MTGMDDRAWAPLDAHQFIIDSIYSPEQIKAIAVAFDGAWARIAPTVGDSPESIQVARFRLADVLLRLERDGRLRPRTAEGSRTRTDVSCSAHALAARPAPPAHGEHHRPRGTIVPARSPAGRYLSQAIEAGWPRCGTRRGAQHESAAQR
jgi:hypothetical protein